jgi:hypothetical protein
MRFGRSAIESKIVAVFILQLRRQMAPLWRRAAQGAYSGWPISSDQPITVPTGYAVPTDEQALQKCRSAH